MKYKILLLLIFYPFLRISAQNKDYAISIVDTLTSPSMHGRGYVNDGNRIAADFIKKEFKKANLKHFGKEYFQPFSYPMNTFQDTIDVFVDENRLVPGKDFVIYSSSPSVDGVFELIWALKDTAGDLVFPKDLDFQELTEKVLVTDANPRKFDYEKYKAKGYVFLREGTVWWHVSDGGSVLPYFRLLIAKDKLSPQNKILRIKAVNVFYEAYPTQNIIGYVKGKVQPDTFLVFTAHYDHLGQMGPEAYFPGGNDNASGTAMLLDLASYFSDKHNRPYYSVAFMAFSGEEAGLLGSKYYVSHPLFALSQIKFLINIDMVGSGSDGIKVVNGSVFKDDFDNMVKLNDENHYLKKVSPRGAAANSDHFPFYDNGVPSFFIYTLGNECKEYHNIYDTPKNVPYTEYDDLFRLLTDFMGKFN